MSIKNPLLESYSSNKEKSLARPGSLTNHNLLNSSHSITNDLLKRSPDINLLSSKSLKPSILTTSSTSALLLNAKATKPSCSLTTSVDKLTYSVPSTLSLLNSSGRVSQSLSLYKKEVKSIQVNTNPQKISDDETCIEFDIPFLDVDDFIPVTVKRNVINNYFDTISKNTVVLTKEEVLKQDFINLAACSLIHVPKLDQKDDSVRLKLVELADKIVEFDPEFILKTALFTRRVLNIRVTANFLVALSGFKKDCRRYMKKYFEQTIVLPSDWIDVAELYTSLGDKNIGFSALPVCLRKALLKKFPKFDVYQIGKYNKNPKKKNKHSTVESDSEDDDTKLYERHHFTLKQLIRKVHICEPPDIVMPILGKKYPETQEDFYRSRLSGIWDEKKAGKRMKIPTPYTWETQLASKGNNAATWKALILSKKLPYMAMLRNLRNIIQSGVSDNIHKIVQKKLCSPEDVKRSKQFPFRFLSAYAVLDGLKEVQTNQTISWSTTPEFEQDTLLEDYKSCLDKAVQLAAINNVKPIKGALLIMFYFGTEMDELCSTKGFGIKRTIREVAGLMTLMCMFSSEHCDVVYFNDHGTAKGKKIETGGEILKFLSSFVDESKSANEKIDATQSSHLTTKHYWTEMIDKEKHYDTIIQIAPSCRDWDAYYNLYRQKVNCEVLTVNINLKSNITSITEGYYTHRNDVHLHGFSDQMLQYISERGSGELLSNVESIDKKFNLLPLPKPMAINYVSPLTRQVTAKVIRIFVSSTFVDLGLERKQMMNSVIPEINKISMEQNITIHEVDLRWGITENEAKSNNVISRCLEEISRCQYFLCLIGRRYGTTFSSYPISPNPDLAWLQSENTELSMTEIEIRHALNLVKLKKLSPKNMIFLIKSDKKTIEYRDIKLQKVLHMIKTHHALEDEVYCREYTERNGKEFNEIAKKALEDVVLGNILGKTADGITDDEMHTSFLDQQALLFVGRQNLLTEFIKIIKKGSVILVTGPVGSGKSALSAKALTMFNNDDRLCDFHHIVKLNSNSKDLKNLLFRLCFHLSKVINEELEDHFEPISTLWGQIAKCEAPLKILIDGCDELIDSSDLFSWLPDKIPSNITIIFTASTSSLWHNFLNKKYSSLITNFVVSKLSTTEKSQVTKEMLAFYGKKLEDKGFNSQLSLLLSKKEANNPLFIDLCINQLRLNAVFENLTQSIRELPHTTEELYIKILKFTTSEIPVCKTVLAYLFCSKNGISESDMLLFLQLKPLVLVNILYYLKLFINADQKTGIMSLANVFARNVVRRHCFNEETSTDIHKSLAIQYAAICDYGCSGYVNLRKDAYKCLLFHYIQAGEWNIVKDYLSDLNFTRQMIYLELLPELLSVFNIDTNDLKVADKIAFKNAMDKEGMKNVHQFLINNKNILAREPFLLKQRLLLHSQSFAESIGYNDTILFNNYVGSFKLLEEANETHCCMMNEHYKSPVSCMDASKSCNIILIGFQDSKLLALDSDNSKIIQTYRGHSGPVTCCGFITSSRFISAGSDGSLRLWGLLDSVCLASISPHIYQVKDIDVNDITKCVLSAGIDRRVAVWYNDVIFETIEFEHPLNCISFIENGKKFVAGSWSGDIFAYDLVQKVKISVKKSGKVHKSSVRCLSAGNSQFATLDITGIISVWDQATLDVLKSVRLNNVTTLSYDCNDLLIYGQSNGIINVTSGFGHMSLLSPSDNVAVTALTKFDNSILVGYYNGTVVKMKNSGETNKLTQHKGKVNFIAVMNVKGFNGSSPSRNFVASCSDDGTVHLSSFDLLKGQIKEIRPHIGKTLAVCSGKTNILFTGGFDCAITGSKFEVNDSNLVSQEVKLYGHQAPVSTLLLLKEGDRLISGSHDGSVMLWNTNQGKCMYTSSNTHTDWVTCSAASSQNASSFVTGSNDNLVILWKLETSRILPINKLMGHMSPVSCVSVLGNNNSDVDMIIGGAQDGTLVLWNKNGKLISSSKAGDRGVNACTFDNEATAEARAYIGTVDGDVILMKPSSLNVVASFTHHNDAVKSVAGMAGTKVASISCDNTVQVWAWNKTTSTNTKLQSITDIQYECVADNVYKIGVLDRIGRVANWIIKDDVLNFVSECDPPKKLGRCCALLPPTADKDAALYEPDDDHVTQVITSKTFTLEFIQEGSKEKMQLRDRLQDKTDYITGNTYSYDLTTHGHITQGNILQMGRLGGMVDVWNLTTRKRITSGSFQSERVKCTEPSHCDWPYPTASSFYDGCNIIGSQTGYIKVPRKKGKDLYERVFNSAVTVIQCVCNKDDEMVLFAGSKDGIIKVLTSELKVMGMYHTSGPVTSLCVLSPDGRCRTDQGDKVYVVAGDKCGVLHVLKWHPPSMEDEVVEKRGDQGIKKKMWEVMREEKREKDEDMRDEEGEKRDGEVEKKRVAWGDDETDEEESDMMAAMFD